MERRECVSETTFEDSSTAVTPASETTTGGDELAHCTSDSEPQGAFEVERIP